MQKKDGKAIALFNNWMKTAGIASLSFEDAKDQKLRGKTLGMVNGGSWISLWTYYFGHKILPGVKLVNAGNEAVQLNFMRAHKNHEECPPKINIEKYVDYAEDIHQLFPVDAILITCSTMNRAYGAVRDSMARHHVPVVQIDEPMMEHAVESNGKILVIATHGPSIRNTQILLQETADRRGKKVSFVGADVEKAFDLLGEGDVEGHNELIADIIRENCKKEKIGIVVLAQLSMSVFKLSYPDCKSEFGVEVLTSAEEGFARVKEIFMQAE